MSDDFVTLESSIDVHLPDHQTLLSFNSDYMTEAFEDWWYFHGGLQKFKDYCEETRGTYE